MSDVQGQPFNASIPATVVPSIGGIKNSLHKYLSSINCHAPWPCGPGRPLMVRSVACWGLGHCWSGCVCCHVTPGSGCCGSCCEPQGQLGSAHGHGRWTCVRAVVLCCKAVRGVGEQGNSRQQASHPCQRRDASKPQLHSNSLNALGVFPHATVRCLHTVCCCTPDAPTNPTHLPLT